MVGWLDNYVSTDENLRPLKEAALARTLVFEESADVDDILAHLPYGFNAVSTAGTLYGNNIVSGGSDDRFPLFRRKERVAEQEALITQLQGKHEIAQRDRNQKHRSPGRPARRVGRDQREAGEPR